MRLRLLPLAALALAAPASAAQRNFSIEDFNRIRVDGPYRVVLTTNVAPFARATGSPDALDNVSIDVEGQTLIIRPNASAWGSRQSKGPVTIAVGTHDLANAWLNGAGTLDIDRVKGESFNLAVEGAGAATVGALKVDAVKLGMSGSGSATLSGTAPTVTAVIRGASTFDGSGLTAKDATIGAEGTAVVKLTATSTAKIDVKGPVTVAVAGNPICTVHGEGAAQVSGCK